MHMFTWFMLVHFWEPVSSGEKWSYRQSVLCSKALPREMRCQRQDTNKHYHRLNAYFFTSIPVVFSSMIRKHSAWRQWEFAISYYLWLTAKKTTKTPYLQLSVKSSFSFVAQKQTITVALHLQWHCILRMNSQSCQTRGQVTPLWREETDRMWHGRCSNSFAQKGMLMLWQLNMIGLHFC